MNCLKPPSDQTVNCKTAQDQKAQGQMVLRKISSLLSLSARAGLLVTGEGSAEKNLKSGSAELIIIARDASDNTKKKFENKCFFYQKPARVFGERAVLSKCVGKTGRTVFTVIDKGFAARLQALIDEVNIER